jgi:hypothetical protein
MRLNPAHPVWTDMATIDCPIDFYNTLYVQGLVALSDAREQDGGFQCVPGSHVSGLHRELGPRGMGGNIQVCLFRSCVAIDFCIICARMHDT